MIDWGSIVGFDWDAGNDTKNLLKHRVEKSEAEQVFFNRPLIVAIDSKHSLAESRFSALGTTSEGRRLFVAFTIGGDGTLIRVISVRDMTRRERAIHAEAH